MNFSQHLKLISKNNKILYNNNKGETMEEKKIATSIDILINIDRFEHLQITKYSEKKITYENNEEMIRKEDQLTDELVKDIIRTMRSMPDKLGKKTNAVTAIEEKIGKKMPTWLEEGGVPNIANTAQKNFDKSVAEVHAKKEEVLEKELANKVETDAFLENKIKDKPKEDKPKPKELDDDLFGDEDLFK